MSKMNDVQNLTGVQLDDLEVPVTPPTAESDIIAPNPALIIAGVVLAVAVYKSDLRSVL